MAGSLGRVGETLEYFPQERKQGGVRESRCPRLRIRAAPVIVARASPFPRRAGVAFAYDCLAQGSGADSAMVIDPVYLVQLAVNGLILGLIYALIAVGLALIFGVLRLINFAHGEFLMVGAYAMTFALPAVGLAYWPAAGAAMICAALLGLIVYQLFLSRLQPGEFERSILITLALSIIILHLVQYLFTANPHLVDTQYGSAGLMVGAIRITGTRVIAAIAALVAFGTLYVLLRHTQFGRAMRALAQNREAAVMVGIRPRTVARNA